MPPQKPTIGMYRVEKPIGAGGMGTVYLGKHMLLGRSAAIKVLRPSLSKDAEIVQRFFNEARTLTLINDPGIVQIFDFGYRDDGRTFIIMELLDGEQMLARLRRIHRFGAVECLRLVRSICSSLSAVHDKGIVHRDLKPGNIFIIGDPAVSGGERTKIFDFGIAKDTVNPAGPLATRAGVLMGTPMYMSPEQCRGVGNIDLRSDIYSLGCVMFTMLTGRPPFGRGAPGELVVAHLREPPPLASSLVSGLPGVVDDVLQRCLQKSPADRFQSMAELADAIDAGEKLLAGTIAQGTTDVARIPRAGTSPALGPHATTGESRSRIAMVVPGQVDSVDPTLDGASGQFVAPTPLAKPIRRTRIAGVITGASLVGVLFAIVVSSIDGSDRESVRVAAPLQVPSSPAPIVQAIEAPDPPQDPPTAKPTKPAGSAATAPAPPPDPPEPTKQQPTKTVAREGAPKPAATPSRPAAPSPKRSAPLDPRGDHASPHGSETLRRSKARYSNPEDVTRGD